MITMIKSLSSSREGKLSLDLLVGLSIFLMSFIIVSQLLSGMFGEVRSEISLSHEAYKVSVILAEMSGKWSNGTKNGTDWENNWYRNNVFFLPGLAIEPCVLDYRKIQEFQNATDTDYEKIKELLGLKTPDSDYDFHISLETLNSTPFSRELVLDTTGIPVLDTGEDIPQVQLARFERIVEIRDYSNISSPTIISGKAVAKLVVVVW